MPLCNSATKIQVHMYVDKLTQQFKFFFLGIRKIMYF